MYSIGEMFTAKKTSLDLTAVNMKTLTTYDHETVTRAGFLPDGKIIDNPALLCRLSPLYHWAF